MSKSMRLAIGIAVLALAGVACGAQRSTNLAASKAGGAGPPLALTIGTDDFQGKPASAQIEEFARRVKELSEGSITVDPVWHSAGDGPDWDQRVARMVVSGELDMGNIPARAWDTEGVTSLRALNAPFLITTDELVAGVITSELADELMSGLEEIGVVGLALLPEGLRHPFGFGRPLLGPEDYEGKTIRTPTSATTAAVFAALGATVTDDEPNAAEQAGMESAYILTPAGNATGNVTFYPKVNSLVINSQVLAELSDQQREILQQAATETRSWAVENLPSDAAAAAAFCELDHAVVMAEEADVTALEEAMAPVYAVLERDELTKSLIGRIREMKTTIEASAPAAVPCGDPSDSATSVTGTRSVIDGIYRFEVTEDQFRAEGVGEAEIRAVTGVYTATFQGGNVSFVQMGPYPESHAEDKADHFTVERDRLTIVWPDGKTEVFSWTTNDNGDLYLTIVSTPPEWLAVDKVYTAQPWVRIGEVAEARIPDGIYRAEIRLSAVEAAGYSNDDGWTGTWTMVLTGDTYALTCKILEDPTKDCGNSGGIDDVLDAGFIETAGDTVAFVYDAALHSAFTGCQPPCFPLPTYEVTWSMQGDTLTFSDLEVHGAGTGGLDKVLAPWVRLGDVEDAGFPVGSYRTEHTVESLVAAGFPPAEAPNNVGIWTLTFDDGALTIHDTLAGTCHGTYTVQSGRVELRLGSDPACGTAANQALFSAGWRLDKDTLRFLDLEAPADGPILEALFAKPAWKKID